MLPGPGPAGHLTGEVWRHSHSSCHHDQLPGSAAHRPLQRYLYSVNLSMASSALPDPSISQLVSRKRLDTLRQKRRGQRPHPLRPASHITPLQILLMIPGDCRNRCGTRRPDKARAEADRSPPRPGCRGEAWVAAEDFGSNSRPEEQHH